MDLLDAILIVLLVLAISLGFRRGAVLQFFTFTGLLLGIVLGTLLAPRTVALAEDPAAQAAIAVATVLIPAGIGDLLGWIVGGRLREKARGTRLRPADSVGGSLIAALATVLVIWVVSFSLANGPFPVLASQIQRSGVVRAIDTVLPEPPSLFTEARRFFNAVGFPDVFVGLPPAPADPVQPPSRESARVAFDAAAGSTVRVVGEACGRIQQGSGFVADGDLIVTNAHVIAGETEPAVQFGGEEQDAIPVLFDAERDIAILRVPRPPDRTLALAERIVPRGTDGAVVGYPGGGGLRGEPAAVRSSIEASSPDIYGDGDVERRLYELQTEVIPGNSGGPFVLTTGEVAGIVVSASTANRDLGYAIASTEVRPLVEQARTRLSGVSTGPCAR